MAAIADIKTSDIINISTFTTDNGISVDRTFAPEGFILPGVARWVDRTSGIALLYPSFSLSVRKPTKASRVYRVTAKIILPTADITSPSTASGIQPQPSKAYENTVIMEFLLPERGTLAERVKLFSILKSLLFPEIRSFDGSLTDSTASPLIAAVTNFDPPY